MSLVYEIKIIFFTYISCMDTKTNPLYPIPPSYSSAQVIMSYLSILCRSALVDIVSMYVCLEKEVDYIPVYIYLAYT